MQIIALLSALLRIVKVMLCNKHPPKCQWLETTKSLSFARVSDPSQGSREALLILIILVLQVPPHQTFLVATPEGKSALENRTLPFQYSYSTHSLAEDKNIAPANRKGGRECCVPEGMRILFN